MKKLLKSGICESVNNTWMHCSLWKSQQMRAEWKKIIKKEKSAGQKPDATIIWIQSGTRITHFVEANVFYAAVHTCFFWTEIVTKQPSTSFCILHQNPHPVYIYVRQWLRLYSHSQHYSLRVREYFVSFFFFFYHVSVFFLIINFFKWAVVERGMTMFLPFSLSPFLERSMAPTV